MFMPDQVILQVNAAGKKAKHEKYRARLTFENRNKGFFAWNTEDNLNKLMGDKSLVTNPDISSDFPGVLLESENDGATTAVETLVIYNTTAYEVSAANTGIQNLADNMEGYQPSPLLLWIMIVLLMKMTMIMMVEIAQE